MTSMGLRPATKATPCVLCIDLPTPIVSLLPQGQLCGECEFPTYFRLGSYCRECPAASGFVFFLMFLVLAIVSLLVLKFARPHLFKINAFEIGLNFTQLISIFASFPLNWPAEVYTMFDIISFFNFNVDLFSPECSMDIGFWYDRMRGLWGLNFCLAPCCAGASGSSS